ncbi:MAG: hypothetical protein Q7J85_12545 [Bacillota bacterium]|nr:hypothetical protein [Bacillota bacterium]
MTRKRHPIGMMMSKGNAVFLYNITDIFENYVIMDMLVSLVCVIINDKAVQCVYCHYIING